MANLALTGTLRALYRAFMPIISSSPKKSPRTASTTILAFCDNRLWKWGRDGRYHVRCAGSGLVSDGGGEKYRAYCGCLCHLVGGDMVKPMGDYLWALREATREAIESGDGSDVIAASLAMFSEFDHLLWSDSARREVAINDGWDQVCADEAVPF